MKTRFFVLNALIALSTVLALLIPLFPVEAATTEPCPGDPQKSVYVRADDIIDSMHVFEKLKIAPNEKRAGLEQLATSVLACRLESLFEAPLPPYSFEIQGDASSTKYAVRVVYQDGSGAVEYEANEPVDSKRLELQFRSFKSNPLPVVVSPIPGVDTAVYEVVRTNQIGETNDLNIITHLFKQGKLAVSRNTPIFSARNDGEYGKHFFTGAYATQTPTGFPSLVLRTTGENDFDTLAKTDEFFRYDSYELYNLNYAFSNPKPTKDEIIVMTRARRTQGARRLTFDPELITVTIH